jgi:hypothetical protein
MLLHERKLFPVDYCGTTRRRINKRLGIASRAIQYFSEILQNYISNEINYVMLLII